jgi:hypothetical protein
MAWRRRSESNGVFTDCQPQYPDLQGYFSSGFTGVQALYETIRHLPDLTRHIPAAHTVIEEIVEGFVEGFLMRLECVRIPTPRRSVKALAALVLLALTNQASGLEAAPAKWEPPAPRPQSPPETRRKTSSGASSHPPGRPPANPPRPSPAM